MRAEEEEEHDGVEEETPQTRRAEFIEELLRDVGLPDRYTSLHVLLSFVALPQRATSDFMCSCPSSHCRNVPLPISTSSVLIRHFPPMQRRHRRRVETVADGYAGC